MGYQETPVSEVGLTTEQYWQRAIALMASFTTKHREIDAVRDLTRLRKLPLQVMEGKYLITARNAMGWAIAQQMRAFFDPAPRKVDVEIRGVKKKGEDKGSKPKELATWLLGSSDEVNREMNDIESAFIWNGIESGNGIIGAAFDPYRAKQGLFPVEVMAPDPRNCAYDGSAYSMTEFVSQDLRTVGALREELAGYRKKASGSGLFEPTKLVEDDPTTLAEDTRYFNDKVEVRFIDGELVYKRKHFLGRVPYAVANWYNVPSELPEEQGLGVISPVRDLLESYQQLIDIFATDAELGQRPLAILFDGQS